MTKEEKAMLKEAKARIAAWPELWSDLVFLVKSIERAEAKRKKAKRK
jgi:hypothetical protein